MSSWQIIDAGGVLAVKNTLQYHSGDPQAPCSLRCAQRLHLRARVCPRQVAISALQMINELAKHEGCKAWPGACR